MKKVHHGTRYRLTSKLGTRYNKVLTRYNQPPYNHHSKGEMSF